ncbi:MAG TPA: CDP-alcohol phosphatidyltransferase family protein [Candidatus Acidoferrales bacterium]
MYTRWIGKGGGWLLDRLVGLIAATGVNPNILSYIGLGVTAWAAVLFATGKFRWAAAVIFLAGFFDLADGHVARRLGRTTVYGAFLDSMLDRYSDMLLYMGIIVYYAKVGRFFYVILAAVAMAGSFMVSYTRARAESLIPSCRVGFMERPERLVLLIIGGVFNRMAPVLWMLAGFTTVTVIHRIVYTYREIAAGRTLANAQAGQTHREREELKVAGG